MDHIHKNIAKLKRKKKLLTTKQKWQARFTEQIGQARIADTKRSRPCNITTQHCVELLYAQAHRCAISGIPLTNNRRDLQAASIDRIDSTKGHTKDNIHIVARFVNLGKGALPDQDARNFFSYYLDTLLNDLQTLITAMREQQEVKLPSHLNRKDIERLLNFIVGNTKRNG